MEFQEFVANLDRLTSCLPVQYNQSERFLYCFINLLHLISSFSNTRSSLVPYSYVPIESIDCIILNLKQSY